MNVIDSRRNFLSYFAMFLETNLSAFTFSNSLFLQTYFISLVLVLSSFFFSFALCIFVSFVNNYKVATIVCLYILYNKFLILKKMTNLL